jgi:LysR family transcriptional activator of nhaA
MAQLALNRMDMVIADEPITRKLSVKAYNHALGSSPMSFFAAPQLQRTLQGRFPECLNGAPMLIPGPNASMRAPFEAWLTRWQLQPRVVAECDDSALMQAFGREGRGVFPTPCVVESETIAQYGVLPVGRSDDLVNDFYAISVERRITHPGVAAITQSARSELFQVATPSGT